MYYGYHLASDEYHVYLHVLTHGKHNTIVYDYCDDATLSEVLRDVGREIAKWQKLCKVNRAVIKDGSAMVGVIRCKLKETQ